MVGVHHLDNISTKNHPTTTTAGIDAAAPTVANTASTTAVAQQQQQQVAPEIQTLGRKARERLQLERSKRREIHRIDHNVLPPPGTTTATDSNQLLGKDIPEATKNSALIDAVNLEMSKKRLGKVATHSRKRRRASTKCDGVNKTNQVEDRNIDRWMPDISHLLDNNNHNISTTVSPQDNNELLSNVVQLHGLPLATTTAHIRRFFSGLDPRRLLFLVPPPPATSRSFTNVDARYNVQRKCGIHSVDRCDSTIRVLVQFATTAIATLATQRCSEILQLNSESGAAVAVTQLEKHIATYFVSKLGVDLPPGQSIQTTIHTVESALCPIVPYVLWETAIRDLKLKVDNINSSGDSNSSLDESSYRSLLREIQMSSRSDIDSLKQHRTRLADEVDRLKLTLPFPTAEIGLDPNVYENNPIVSFTNRCVIILQWHIERCETAINMASRFKFLQQTRPTPPSTTTSSLAKSNKAATLAAAE